MFCTYRQRSSSGGYILTDSLSHYVCVEAESEQHAHDFLISLSSKAAWGEVYIDDEPIVEHSKGAMPLGEYIASKYNRHRRKAIVFYANGRKEHL